MTKIITENIKIFFGFVEKILERFIRAIFINSGNELIPLENIFIIGIIDARLINSVIETKIIEIIIRNIFILILDGSNLTKL